MSTDSQKRRLAAIFSKDVKGYSRLMQDDEKATVETLKACRAVITEAVEKHQGRVVDSPGDNLLADFSSVIDAVQAAIDLQSELAKRNADLPEHRRMDFRIGINLGDVIEEEGRLYGDGVNVAARIERLADAGGIAVSAAAYEQVRSKLDVEGKYLGQFEVKNIAEPVKVWALLTEATSVARTRAKRERQQKSRRAGLLAGFAVVVAIVAVGLWSTFFQPVTTSQDSLTDKPSIAVLPFDNLSGDPEQEYFSDGMTEDIITDLSKISGLFVIARNSTFTFKGKAVKVQQVAEDLGVRYVLEGSVRKAGEKVRINAQLVDARDGDHPREGKRRPSPPQGVALSGAAGTVWTLAYTASSRCLASRSPKRR